MSEQIEIRPPQGNRPLPRSSLVRLCLELGHDPTRVDSVTLTAHEALVTYRHHVTEGIEE